MRVYDYFTLLLIQLIIVLAVVGVIIDISLRGKRIAIMEQRIDMLEQLLRGEK